MKRTVEFFPRVGERHCPVEYLTGLPPQERARIYERLKLLADREPADWPMAAWIKVFEGKVYQLKTPNSRVMLFLDGSSLVVIHAFKKVGQKTRREDIERMRSNYHTYHDHKGAQSDRR